MKPIDLDASAPAFDVLHPVSTIPLWKYLLAIAALTLAPGTCKALLAKMDDIADHRDRLHCDCRQPGTGSDELVRRVRSPHMAAVITVAIGLR